MNTWKDMFLFFRYALQYSSMFLNNPATGPRDTPISYDRYHFTVYIFYRECVRGNDHPFRACSIFQRKNTRVQGWREPGPKQACKIFKIYLGSVGKISYNRWSLLVRNEFNDSIQNAVSANNFSELIALLLLAAVTNFER